MRLDITVALEEKAEVVAWLNHERRRPDLKAKMEESRLTLCEYFHSDRYDTAIATAYARCVATRKR